MLPDAMGAGNGTFRRLWCASSGPSNEHVLCARCIAQTKKSGPEGPLSNCRGRARSARCPPHESGRLLGLGCLAYRQLFANSRRFARTAAQIVKFRPAHVAPALHLDRRDQRRVRLERALDTLAARDLAHGECRIEAAIALGDHHALVRLHAPALTFDDIDVDDHRVAGGELGNRLVEPRDLLALQRFDDVHGVTSFLVGRKAACAQRRAPPDARVNYPLVRPGTATALAAPPAKAYAGR